jgi:hypothetical protein
MPEETTLDTAPVEEWVDWEEELDYKALYEKEKERADKRQSRFKSAKAQEKEKAQYQIDDSYIDNKVKEELFFEKNSTASEFREEVKKIQSQYTWMDAKTAFELYLAKNKPELLSQTPSSTWVEGITKDPEPEKDWRQMSDKEFDERWRARKGKK